VPFDVLTLVAAPAGLSVLAWRYRWITDDGLIMARTVRQILAGHGPVFNAGERVEANTSALWTWLVAGLAWATHADVYGVIEVASLVLGPLGLLLALLGTRRLYRREGSAAPPLVPVGAGVVVALPPFWEFITSGLETPLILCWLGLSWWLLTGLPGAGRGRAYATAFVIGLGWLVRPDMLIVTLCFAAVLAVIRRPGWRGAALLTAAGAVVPLGYEIFRMGYYGLLVPNTAVAKSATASDLRQGFTYLGNYVGTYLLWVPLAALAALTPVVLLSHRLERGVRVAAVAAAVAGLLLAAYVVWVGGDFMHARMLLPATFALLLPVMGVPVPSPWRLAWLARAAVGLGAAGVAAWAVFCGLHFRMPQALMALPANGITNEREFWVERTGVANPVTPDPYIHMVAGTTDPVVALTRIVGFTPSPRDPRLVYLDAKGRIATAPLDRPGVPLAVTTDVLGTMGAIVPLDGVIVDTHGLAYAYASHTYPIPGGRIGHDKTIGMVWVLADYAGTAVTDGSIAETRDALGCGALAELGQATRAPLTWGRFWQDVGDAYTLTTVRIPDDPRVAVESFCGPG
jgi:arabinofuranosyltransferase